MPSVFLPLDWLTRQGLTNTESTMVVPSGAVKIIHSFPLVWWILISDEMKSYVLSSSTNVFDFEKFILNKLKNYNLIDESVMKLRMEFLNKAKFKTLTHYLEKIADSKI